MGFLDKIFGSSEEENTTPKINWTPLTDLGQLNEIINESVSKPVAIFKHSTRCSVSRMALRQFESEFNLTEKVTPYFLDLLEHRDISNEIASRFGVEHQSPQLLLIRNGKSIYDASHSSIDVEDLDRYL
ncbi:bacillithiol system redox-active protein YtxJ [Flavobacterium sp. SUN052]|jgi:bacillithiol system protein YtxJ|uniref:bacillithiol system redox-active protein YtxJ n=1 Tax=Flavobacterium sp. SUN052 TaxID=3002441 RepID=UPI00237DDCAD|nr:bacillithiol system redox-active protein YtxJ [Flavobacterium sp. SUN052]MEC4003752.1 bacillithiol system redox-active protein YtxJ [Flavobacterium sp. SUN052]